MERNKTKRKENELTAELTKEVEKDKKEEKMTTATKPKTTKQPKATQALIEPTEEKFLSAKDLAQMAGVAPAVLRKTLRSDFAGKIPRDKDGKQYQIKATDPLVEEIVAKVKAGNGGKPKEALSSEDKGEGDKPSPESLEGKVVK